MVYAGEHFKVMKNDGITIPHHMPGLKEKLFFLLSGIIVSIPLTSFASVYPAQLCESLPLFYSQVCIAAIFAPFIEEFAKAYPLFYRHGETGKSFLTLGFLVGIGFGITEFFLYVFGLGAPVILRLPGIFFHASTTSITAYGIVTKRPVPFYLIAVALHLSYNFSAILGIVWLVVGPAALIITYSLAWHLYRKSTDRMVF